MWSDASLEASKVEATKDALYRLGKPAKSADVKAEVQKLHWEYYQAFPLFDITQYSLSSPDFRRGNNGVSKAY